MCGIFAYVGARQAAPLIIAGLKRLEYRGYDSAGICIRNAAALSVIKSKGRIADVEADAIQAKGTIGIGHTRWATHGPPTTVNAHPHMDCAGTIAIVHNGIIENHHALRALLAGEDHTFASDTDSEIIAHLIEKFYAGDLQAAVAKAMGCMEGALGLVVMHRDAEGLVAARRGSPLIIGVGDGETLVSSDASALVEHTDQAIYLKDDELATIDAKGVRITTIGGVSLDPAVERINCSVEHIRKNGRKHFMRKEIEEQDDAIANTLRGRIKDGQVKISVDIDIGRLRRVIITGCGTSWHSALIGKHLIESLTGIPVEVDYASEFRYRHPIVLPGDVLVAMSQSGETADTLAAIKEAKRRGAKCVSIVNVVGSSITREVDSGIYLHAGPEIGVASTKAFTCQVTALVLLAIHIMQLQRKSVPADLIEALESLPDAVRRAIALNPNVEEVARIYADASNFIYLGRGINFPVALEGALKLKEVSYIHAEGYPAAEMKHGPIALIDKDMPVVFLTTNKDISSKIVSNMQEVKARGGRIIAVTDGEEAAVSSIADHVLMVPKVLDLISPIVNVIPLQLLAYHIADLKGLDVDKPRNLAKSVTVE
ncbi:MAG: glutamine--fructose-6-phosphate transaminase (isomerizing) [Nanoarchaeota archaeon]